MNTLAETTPAAPSTRLFTPPSERELEEIATQMLARAEAGETPNPRDAWLLVQSEYLLASRNEARYAACIEDVAFGLPEVSLEGLPIVKLDVSPKLWPLSPSAQHEMFMAHRLAHVSDRPRWYCAAPDVAAGLMTMTPYARPADLRTPLPTFGIQIPPGILALEDEETGFHWARQVIVAECDASKTPHPAYPRTRQLLLLVRCEANERSPTMLENLDAFFSIPLDSDEESLARDDALSQSIFVTAIKTRGLFVNGLVSPLEWRRC